MTSSRYAISLNTGAVTQKRGKLEMAEGGTLFLDELGELGEQPQAMLLRVLQTREFQRLGGNRTIRADIRIIAATNKNLETRSERRLFARIYTIVSTSSA